MTLKPKLFFFLLTKNGNALPIHTTIQSFLKSSQGIQTEISSFPEPNKTTMRKFIFLFTISICSFSLLAQQEKLDLDMIAKIRAEGINKSDVMDIAFHLTDASGPRLMNSPGFFRAANWAKAELKEWGLENSALEPWGTFGKGWELQKSYIAMTDPY